MNKSWFLLIRAADGNRTRDLHITNVTLYRLSHSSIFSGDALAITENKYIKSPDECQQYFLNFFNFFYINYFS